MGELSESLKKVSLGSILVVVGIVSILTLAVYWYVFSEVPSSIPYSRLQEEPGRLEFAETPARSPGIDRAAESGPDNRTVIVETPPGGSQGSITGQTNTAEASLGNPGQDGTLSIREADSGTITIQVGAFSKSEGASKLAAELSGKGYTPLANSSGGMYRVFVGDFPDREEAEAMLEGLEAAGFKGYVRTVP